MKRERARTKSEDAPVLISFKAGPDVVEAIDKLAAADADGTLSGGRSFAIRRTLLKAAAALEPGGK